MSKIGLIVSREFNQRVRKKSFILTTILTPLLLVGLMVAPALVRRGIAYVDRGIEAYPSRLDMRFGKIRALGEIGDYGRYDEAKPLC